MTITVRRSIRVSPAGRGSPDDEACHTGKSVIILYTGTRCIQVKDALMIEWVHENYFFVASGRKVASRRKVASGRTMKSK